MSLTVNRDKTPRLRNKREETRYIKKCKKVLDDKVLLLATIFFDFAEDNQDQAMQQAELERLNKVFLDWIQLGAVFDLANVRDHFMKKICDGLDVHNAIAEQKGIGKKVLLENKFVGSIKDVSDGEEFQKMD